MKLNKDQVLTLRRGVRTEVRSVIDPSPDDGVDVELLPVEESIPSNDETTPVRMLVTLDRPPVSDEPSPDAPADSVKRK